MTHICFGGIILSFINNLLTPFSLAARKKQKIIAPGHFRFKKKKSRYYSARNRIKKDNSFSPGETSCVLLLLRRQICLQLLSHRFCATRS